jgi:hypothetical protein
VKDWVKDPDIIKDWNMLGWKIDHCLSHEVPVEDKCSVSYSPHLASGMYSPRSVGNHYPVVISS